MNKQQNRPANKGKSLADQLGKTFPNVKKQDQTLWTHFNQLPNTPRPKEDGETHINISSMAKTELGSVLWVETSLPFKHTVIGRCKSIAAAWDFVTTGCVLPPLRNMDRGPRRYKTNELKQTPGEAFVLQHPNYVYMDLVWSMLSSYPRLREEVVKTTLPFDCYMLEGELSLPYRFSSSRRIVETMELIREALAANKSPDFSAYSGGLKKADVYAQFKNFEDTGGSEVKKNSLLEELTMPTTARARKRASVSIAPEPSAPTNQPTELCFDYRVTAGDGVAVRSVTNEAIRKFLLEDLAADQNEPVPIKDRVLMSLEVYFAISGIKVAEVEAGDNSGSIVAVQLMVSGSANINDEKIDDVKITFLINGVETTIEEPLTPATSEVVQVADTLATSGYGYIVLNDGIDQTTCPAIDITEDDRIAIITHLYSTNSVDGCTCEDKWETKSSLSPEDMKRDIVFLFRYNSKFVVEEGKVVTLFGLKVEAVAPEFDIVGTLAAGPREEGGFDAEWFDCFGEDALCMTVSDPEDDGSQEVSGSSEDNAAKAAVETSSDAKYLSHDMPDQDANSADETAVETLRVSKGLAEVINNVGDAAVVTALSQGLVGTSDPSMWSVSNSNIGAFGSDAIGFLDNNASIQANVGESSSDASVENTEYGEREDKSQFVPKA